MMPADTFIPWGSLDYFILLGVLLFSRGADFFSTWLATPNLVLEGNPIAKRLGWKGGVFINSFLCLVFAVWPLPAVILSTTSLMVAARNFQSAWLMRSMGEERYRYWMAERLAQGGASLYLFCIFAQTLLIALVGWALIAFSQLFLIPFGVGVGMVAYSLLVIVFTLYSVWHLKKSHRFNQSP